MLKHRPLLEAACLWIAGSAIGQLFAGKSGFLIWAACLLIYPLYAVWTNRTVKQAALILFVFTGAFFYWQLHESQNVTHLPEGLRLSENQLKESSVRLQGILVSAVERDGDRADFTIEVRKAEYKAASGAASGGEAASKPAWVKINREKLQVQVKLAEESEILTIQSWSRGQLAVIGGTLELPGGARNFGGFDYGKYLHNQHVHWLLKVPGASAVKVSPGPFSLAKLLGYNDKMRQAVGERIGSLFGGINSGYMKGLLIGDTEELDPNVYSGFSALGLTHILAISGSHVAVNVAVLFWLLRRLRIPRETSITVVICFIPFYMLLTGLSPSVVRAGIMAVIGLFLLRKRRLKDGLHILAAAALLMLIWEPHYLLNVSFQLSFAVTAGLIVFVPLVQPLFAFLPKRLAGAAAITLTAQLISFPLTIYYFNQFSLLSLVSNLLLVPVVSMLSLPLGTASLGLSYLFEPLGRMAAYPVKEINALTFHAVAWLEAKDGFMTLWKSPPLWWIAIYYILLFGLLSAINRAVAVQETKRDVSGDETLPLLPHMAPKGMDLKGARFKGVSISRPVYGILLCGILLGGMLYEGYLPLYAHGTGIVQYIDVGQGDCILITTPQGRNLLVDTGGTVSFRKKSEAWRDRKVPYEVGAKVVVPMLKKRGIHALDAVIVTHWDQDHSGGLQAVLEQIPVKALVMNGSVTDTTVFQSLFRLIEARQVPVYYAHAGLELKADKQTVLQFLGPVEDEMKEQVRKEQSTEEQQAEEQQTDGQQTEAQQVLKLPQVKEQNGRSVVFLMNLKGVRFLFTGDMEAEEEQKVMAYLAHDQGMKGKPNAENITTRESPVDVLKVAHHGSKTSSTDAWINYWKPRQAVISVGKNNTYGHPNEDVVNRLRTAGAEILRTDERGEIQIRIKSGDMSIRHKVEK